MSYPEPSLYDHNASWNLDDEGNCCCYRCQKQRKDLAREEQGIDDYEDRKLQLREA